MVSHAEVLCRCLHQSFGDLRLAMNACQAAVLDCFGRATLCLTEQAQKPEERGLWSRCGSLTGRSLGHPLHVDALATSNPRGKARCAQAAPGHPESAESTAARVQSCTGLKAQIPAVRLFPTICGPRQQRHFAPGHLIRVLLRQNTVSMRMVPPSPVPRRSCTLTHMLWEGA